MTTPRGCDATSSWRPAPQSCPEPATPASQLARIYLHDARTIRAPTKVRTAVKNMIKRASLMTLGVVMLLAGRASAAPADGVVTAKVPFAFVVNETELPAGDYVLSRDTRTPDLIEIATAAGRRVALVLTQASSGNRQNEQPQLEFARVGNQVFLSQITLGPGSVRDIFVPAADE